MKIERSVKIHRPNPQILIITRPRLHGILLLAVCIVLLVIFYYLFELNSIPEGAPLFDSILARLSAKQDLWIVVYLTPVLIPYLMWKGLKIAAVGEKFSFDGVRREIFCNQKPLARFEEVEHLQLEKSYYEEKKQGYQLKVVLESGKKIRFYNSENRYRIISLANDVADIVKVKVISED